MTRISVDCPLVSKQFAQQQRWQKPQPLNSVNDQKQSVAPLVTVATEHNSNLKILRNNINGISATETTNFNLKEEDSDDDSVSHQSSSVDSDYREVDEDEFNYSDDDDEEEPPHPLGFDTQYTSAISSGRSRYSVDSDPPESIETYKRRHGYQYYMDEDDCLFQDNLERFRPQFPPLTHYLDPMTVPTSRLIQYQYNNSNHRTKRHKFFDQNDMATVESKIDEMTQMLHAAKLKNQSKPIAAIMVTSANIASLEKPFQTMHNDMIELKHEMNAERQRIEKEHVEAAQALQRLLQENEEAAAVVLRNEAHLSAELEKQDKQLATEAAAEEELRQAKQKKKEEEENEKAERLEKKKAEQQAEVEKVAKESDYVGRAQKLVAQLVQLRASVKPFDESKDVLVKKRRLQIKKIVSGRVSTLAENVDKIRQIASEVTQAINEARDEDERAKQQISQGNQQYRPEMTKGKRYLIDLLASNAMVRVQAEGHNGLRGDGFPLANMLALVSLNNKDLGLVLAAHIYTACPIAIPYLPVPAPDDTQEVLMKNLGMMKNSDNSFESFEKFLTRTESIISFMANIMSSMPENHTLLGGHASALKWLSRFVVLLPDDVSPLPLITAPVLDAFLTGAGHMLANKYTEEFEPILDKITDNILKRLDNSPIGAPSATRLKKTLSGGLVKFKEVLPSKALSELYNRLDGTSGTRNHSLGSDGPNSLRSTSMQQASPFGATKSVQSSTTSALGVNSPSTGGLSTFSANYGNNPFAPALVNTNDSLFGALDSSARNGSSKPLDMTTSTESTLLGGFASSPSVSESPSQMLTDAGMSSNELINEMEESQTNRLTSASLPFGQSSGTEHSNFGQFGINKAQSGFDNLNNANMIAPSLGFGGSGMSLSSTPSPFGQPSSTSSPFGQPSSTSSPFGQPSSASSPFGQPSSTTTSVLGTSTLGTAPASSPFSTLNNTSQPSTFGTSQFGGKMAPVPLPFGTISGPTPSPFSSSPAPSVFGSVPMSSNFGTNPLPSPFGTTTTSSTFGSSPAPSTFGLASAPSPFGSTLAPSPFGSALASTPFSTQAQAPLNAPSSSPFGTTQAPSPFGSSFPTSNFGSAPATNFGGPFSTSNSGGASATTPFGTSAPTLFGSSSNVTGSSNFASPSVFGSSAASSSTPFGSSSFVSPSSTPFSVAPTSNANFTGFNQSFSNTQTQGRPLCKFYAQGNCRYGNNCRFSHSK